MFFEYVKIVRIDHFQVEQTIALKRNILFWKSQHSQLVRKNAHVS